MFQNKTWIKMPKWTIFEIYFFWKYQSLSFHYWEHLTMIWCINWQSIIDVVENLCVVLLILVLLIGMYLTSISKNLVMLKTMQMIKTGIKYFKTRFLNALGSFIDWKRKLRLFLINFSRDTFFECNLKLKTKCW